MKYVLMSLFVLGAATYAGSSSMLLLSKYNDAPRVGDVVLLDFKSIPGDGEADTAEETDAVKGNDWVLVTSAVNMRDGPSSSFAVLKVQPKGVRLAVTHRDGSWVEVVDSDTGQEGWVFSRYVEEVTSIQEGHPARLAVPADLTMDEPASR